jgi:hypothetical protein
VATFAPAQLAKGAARLPLPYGLFSVLNFDTPADQHWQAGGVTWEFLDSTGIDSVGHPDDTDGSPSTGTPKDFSALDGIETALPFSVYGHWKVSPVAYSQASAEEKALEHLRAFEEAQVEKQLWYGLADNEPNLTDDLTDVATTDAAEAVWLLEEFLAQTYGSKGVIHMARSVALELIADKVLETKGSQLLTALGTPVVASSQYPKTHIRATPALFGLRSEVFTSSQPGSPLLDVRNNDLYAIAERTYLIGFDPTGVGSVTLS